MARLAKRLAGPKISPSAARLNQRAIEFERMAQLARVQNEGGF
jgi:hypothetical protein